MSSINNSSQQQQTILDLYEECTTLFQEIEIDSKEIAEQISKITKYMRSFEDYDSVETRLLNETSTNKKDISKELTSFVNDLKAIKENVRHVKLVLFNS